MKNRTRLLLLAALSALALTSPVWGGGKSGQIARAEQVQTANTNALMQLQAAIKTGNDAHINQAATNVRAVKQQIVTKSLQYNELSTSVLRESTGRMD